MSRQSFNMDYFDEFHGEDKEQKEPAKPVPSTSDRPSAAEVIDKIDEQEIANDPNYNDGVKSNF